MSVGIDFALPEKRAARRAFDRATAFDEACFIHDEARARLLERLMLVRVDARAVVDLGCATGRAAAALAARYPGARVLAVDSSRGMWRFARGALPESVAVIGADAERLPLTDHSTDLLFANLVLPWCRPDVLFAEAARVLSDGGLLLFATLGPDTLAEVRRAFGAVDKGIHVHAAFDMHDLGDLALAAGLAEPVLDVDRLEVTYAEIAGLVRDLRAIGAVNTAGGRRRTLTGTERWRGFEAKLAGRPGRFGVTVELVLGQAFGRGASRPRRPPEPTEIRVPIERIGRPSEST